MSLASLPFSLPSTVEGSSISVIARSFPIDPLILLIRPRGAIATTDGSSLQSLGPRICCRFELKQQRRNSHVFDTTPKRVVTTNANLDPNLVRVKCVWLGKLTGTNRVRAPARFRQSALRLAA